MNRIAPTIGNALIAIGIVVLFCLGLGWVLMNLFGIK